MSENSERPPIGPAEIEIVWREIGKFKGIYALRPDEAGPANFKIDCMASAGFGALIAAQEAFDPLRGARWSTLATTCVRYEVRRAAKPLIEDAMADPRRLVSLDKPVSDGEGGTAPLMDFVPDADKTTPFNEHAWSLLRSGLTRWRDYQTLRLKAEGWSNAEIGKHLGLTEERARQIYQEALEKARELALERPFVRFDAEMAAARSVARSRIALRPTGLWGLRDNERFQEEWEARGCYPDATIVERRVKPQLVSITDIAADAAEELRDQAKVWREFARDPVRLTKPGQGFDAFAWRHKCKTKPIPKPRARDILRGSFNDILEYIEPPIKPNGLKFVPSSPAPHQVVFKGKLAAQSEGWRALTEQMGQQEQHRVPDSYRSISSETKWFGGVRWQARSCGEVWVRRVAPLRRVGAPSIVSGLPESEPRTSKRLAGFREQA